MKFTDSVKMYNKYLKIQADMLDLETVGEKSEEVCERLQDLARYPQTDERWCDAVERAICETEEYINLCVYLCSDFGDGRTLIIPDTIGVVVELCELKYSIASREGEDFRRDELMEQVAEVICDAGSSVRIQDEKYWLSISRMFDLDPDGTIRAEFERDLETLASGGEIAEEEGEELSDEEETVEGLAKKVIKEALKTPNQLITTAWIQRRFNYGYGKAALLLDWLEDERYVQSLDEIKAEGLAGRRILVTEESLENN